MWNAIIRQYTRSPEEVTLEITAALNPIIICSLTFRSLDAAVIRLGIKVAGSDQDDGRGEVRFSTPLEEMYDGVFFHASRVIRYLPLLADAKRLHISNNCLAAGRPRVASIAKEVGGDYLRL